ncbi:MAG: FAD-dependent 5-carboxymethylaminomethyl-2-thiouridine(34) oxidoreductase MnmC [Candidatus Puniceispirillaceae bacterium]
MHSSDDDIAMVALPEVNVTIEGDVITSQDYDDIYFNRADGLAESSYVFCDGTELAERLAHSQHVVIAETGFGTGLNFLAACALRDKINPQCQIDYISFEACPLPADIVTIAHRPYPEIKNRSEALCDALPARWPGYHKVVLDDAKTHLHLYYGEALPHLSVLSFAADIWFLDGFNPAKNPSLWQQDLFEHIFRCSANEARLSTFSAAGFVRRGLSEAGFCVTVKKGFGKKREMITAHKKGAVSSVKKQPHSAIVIGGGIAGTSLCYALQNRGISVQLFEKGEALASGASGNGAAMQSARLRVRNDAAGRLSVACLSYAKKLATRACVIAHEGAITTSVREKDQKRLEKLAKAGWPSELFEALSSEQVSVMTGLDTERTGEWQKASSVIYPAKLTQYLGDKAPSRTNCEVAFVTPLDTGARVTTKQGESYEADLIFIACGADIPEIISSSSLPEMGFQKSAGQVSFWQAPTALSDIKIGVNYGGYMTPVVNGWQYLGASFNREGQTEVTLDGHQHNLDLLPEEWQKFAPDKKMAKGRLSYRLSTKDRMPVCGAVHNCVYILGALGARGMTNAPLLAEALVALALGMPTGLDDEIMAALNPENARL